MTTAAVSAGTYTLSESDGPAGYTAGAWSCTGGDAHRVDSRRPARTASTSPARSTTTTSRRTLTLVKTVTNDNGGTALPTDWTLTAAGPDADLRRRPAPPAVTNAAVNAGTYTLSESGGPAGYTAGRLDLHRRHA